MAISEVSGQLGSARLGLFDLGTPGIKTVQQARVDSFTTSTVGPVFPGSAVTLSWITQFSTTTTLSGTGSVASSGSQVVNPTVTTTYTLTASDGVNPNQTRTLTILVTTPATFLRAAASGPAVGTTLSVTVPVEIGDLIIVGASASFTLTTITVGTFGKDNLGNVYVAAANGNGGTGPPDAAPGNQLFQIAYSIAQFAGTATIPMNTANNAVLNEIVSVYTIPVGMALDQVDYKIGDTTVVGAGAFAAGTAPVNYANSLLITLAMFGGYCATFSSLDGDNLRQQINGCAFPGVGGGGLALFDAFLAGPGIRNSNVRVDPIFPGTQTCTGSACPGPPFYGTVGAGGVQLLTAVFSAPLQRPANFVSQASVRPGKMWTLSGYQGQLAISSSLPFMPRVGEIIFVGASVDWTGGAQPVWSVSDLYGNVYVQKATVHLQTPLSTLFYTVVKNLPTSGMFSVTISQATVNIGPSVITLGGYPLNGVDPAQLQAAVVINSFAEGSNFRYVTGTLTVSAGSLIAGFGFSIGTGTSAPAPFIPTAGYTIDAQWNVSQVDVAPLNNAPRLGIGAEIHQYVATAGTYDGEILVNSPTHTGAIIVVALPAATSTAPIIGCPPGIGSLQVGVFFSAVFTVTGGVPPFTFTLISGSFPSGLTLNQTTGLLSGIPLTSGNFTFTVQVTDATQQTSTVTCITVVITGVLIYPVNYRELDSAAQIAAAPPIRTSYTGRLIATDHTRKWTRWNFPAVGAALMYRQAGKLEPIFFAKGNVYALRADLLTDDDFGLITPYYTTYFFVTHDAEMGLTYVDATGERQPLGSGRKLLAYLKAYVAAQAAQSVPCQIVITPFVDNLNNPWALIGLRRLSTQPNFDLEWPGGQTQGDRIALQFKSVPITGTDNGFSLQRLTAFLKRAQRLQIRGAG